MKSVLIPTRPKWCEKICHEIGKDENGKPIYEKRIEVRKGKPSEVPFKAYIYCTSSNVHDCILVDKSGLSLTYAINYKTAIVNGGEIGNGKVIGEFVCDKVDEYTFSHYEAEYRVTHVEQEAMCLNQPELIRYGKGKTLYGWHISDLKIYDKPKELSEFSRPCSYKGICFSYKRFKANGSSYDICNAEITRPPQSWCYVEEL